VKQHPTPPEKDTTGPPGSNIRLRRLVNLFICSRAGKGIYIIFNVYIGWTGAVKSPHYDANSIYLGDFIKIILNGSPGIAITFKDFNQMNMP
jgi:hypothetical protein